MIADSRLFEPPLSSLHPEEKGSLVTIPFIVELCKDSNGPVVQVEGRSRW